MNNYFAGIATDNGYIKSDVLNFRRIDGTQDCGVWNFSDYEVELYFRKIRNTSSGYNDLPCWFFYRAMLCISAVYAGTRCLTVYLSVTFVDHVKTNKHIFEIFSPSGSHTILVFPHETGWRYSDGNPPNGGVECKGV